MNILFTICGRAGSKGFRNKNIKELNGIPLVYYTLSVISLYQEANVEDCVVVAINTDSKELRELVQKQTLITDILFIDRKEELAGNIIGKVKVIQDTYFQCRTRMGFDVIIDLDITSPMRRVCDIENAIKKFKRKIQCDLVVSVVPARRSPYFNMVEKKEQYYGKICGSNYTVRQQAPTAYDLNASIYVYSPNFLEHEISNPILDYSCEISIMPDYLILDIDSEDDLEMLEKIITIFSTEDKELKRIIDRALTMLS